MIFDLLALPAFADIVDFYWYCRFLLASWSFAGVVDFRWHRWLLLTRSVCECATNTSLFHDFRFAGIVDLC